MAKVLYSATMSVDGFIAGPGGDISRLTEHRGPNPTVDDVVGQIGALLVGNRTFRGDDPHKGTAKEGKPFGGGGPNLRSRSWVRRTTCRCTPPKWTGGRDRDQPAGGMF